MNNEESGYFSISDGKHIKCEWSQIWDTVVFFQIPYGYKYKESKSLK